MTCSASPMNSSTIFTFDMLAALGFSQRTIVQAANTYCCGAMTLEGAPGLKEEHLAVFDCANTMRPHRHTLRCPPKATSV